MRIAVYKVTSDGKRQQIKAARNVKGVDYIPPFQNWPVCDCPRHRAEREERISRAS